MTDTKTSPAQTATKTADESVKKGQHNPVTSTQSYLKIAEIHDKIAVLKNGGLRTVLKCSSINLYLKSEQEQNAVIYSYQSFLNTLEFPIQIVVRSRKLDIDQYIANMRKMGEKQKNVLLQRQTLEYADYIQRLVEYADIMEKEFYVVVPYDPFRANKTTMIQKFFSYLNPRDTVTEVRRRRGEFNELKKGLTGRVNSVKSGLENCGLHVEELTTPQLIELLYKVHNPLTSRIQKLNKLQEMSVLPDTTNKEEGA